MKRQTRSRRAASAVAAVMLLSAACGSEEPLTTQAGLGVDDSPTATAETAPPEPDGGDLPSSTSRPDTLPPTEPDAGAADDAVSPGSKSDPVSTTIPADEPDPDKPADPVTTTPEPVAEIPPTAAPVTTEFAAETISTPLFANRAGSASEFGFDIPVPPEWESTVGPDFAAASITGRGDLTVRFYPLDDLAWRAKVNPGFEQEITSGPVALAVPGYRVDGSKLATSGQAIDGQEYRFASTTSFLRQIVRWYEYSGMIVVATLSYPEPSQVPEALTGIAPEQILDDLRLAELVD